jgi:hypothetical protein
MRLLAHYVHQQKTQSRSNEAFAASGAVRAHTGQHGRHSDRNRHPDEDHATSFS